MENPYNVAPGQVWKDMDPRMSRHLLVLRLENRSPHPLAICAQCMPNGFRLTQRETQIRLDRFRGSARSGFVITKP
jgi:hypothetical protein